MRISFTFILACILFFNIPLVAQPTLNLTQVISGLNSPLQIVNAGDGTNRIFIAQKGGTVLVYSGAYSSLGTFLDISSNLSTFGETGLLSIAFHPDYKNNGFFYVYYVNSGGDVQLDRYKVSTNANVANSGSRVTVKIIDHQEFGNHYGGELHFGADGYLYLSTGDGGGAGDPSNHGLNTNSLAGKILRFNVNTTNTAPYYTIPADNPFGNEVYAYGLRNPFRWSFDRVTNALWIGDVGQDAFEEISYRHQDSIKGANFGWRCYEGGVPQDLSEGCDGPITGFVFPVHTYPLGTAPGSVIGGTVYRGATYVDLRGYYIAADYFSGVFYLINYDTTAHTATTTTQTLSPINIADFGETEDGEFYAVSLGSNAVYRIRSSGPLGYKFTGTGNWDVASNWLNNSIPPASLPARAEIIIDPPANGECVLNVPQTILATAKITVMQGKKFKVNGNLTIEQ